MGREADHLLAMAEPIVCKEAGLLEALPFPCPSTLTFYKLREIERRWYPDLDMKAEAIPITASPPASPCSRCDPHPPFIASCTTCLPFALRGVYHTPHGHTRGEAAGWRWQSLAAQRAATRRQRQHETILPERLLLMGVGWPARPDTRGWVQERRGLPRALSTPAASRCASAVSRHHTTGRPRPHSALSVPWGHERFPSGL
jgi:hypothetical protein